MKIHKTKWPHVDYFNMKLKVMNPQKCPKNFLGGIKHILKKECLIIKIEMLTFTVDNKIF